MNDNLTPLAYLKTSPNLTAVLKATPADFIVREHLGYELTGDGEFVAIYVRKTNANTLFVGEKLAQFVGISAREMSYAGLKDRHAITEQWFCLRMPGKAMPDFNQFQLDGVEILQVTRHQRKIRIGSLAGNHFEVLLRGISEQPDLIARLEDIKTQGFPNYFTEQRFGRDGHNLSQALRWANGEIKVKDRKKRSFYLSSARSEVFNLVVSERLKQGLATQILPNDILQLTGSHSWFIADEQEDLTLLQQRLQQKDIQLTAPLIGDTPQPACQLENEIVAQHHILQALMQQERLKTARRQILAQAQDLHWQFEPEGLRLSFYLSAGSYATALIRELAQIETQ